MSHSSVSSLHLHHLGIKLVFLSSLQEFSGGFPSPSKIYISKFLLHQPLEEELLSGCFTSKLQKSLFPQSISTWFPLLTAAQSIIIMIIKIKTLLRNSKKDLKLQQELSYNFKLYHVVYKLKTQYTTTMLTITKLFTLKFYLQ